MHAWLLHQSSVVVVVFIVVIIIITAMDPPIFTCMCFCQHPSNPSPGILALVH